MMTLRPKNPSGLEGLSRIFLNADGVLRELLQFRGLVRYSYQAFFPVEIV